MAQRWGFKMSAGLFLLVLATASCGAIVVADGGDGAGGDGEGGGRSTGGSTTTNSPAASSGTSGRSSSAGGGGHGSLDCDSYCAEIEAACADAAVQQWPNFESCKAACASFTPGTLVDMAGNTLGCRLYHAVAARKDAVSAAIHCPHAGPTGGDMNPTSTGAGDDGPCGDGVEAFCKLAQATCKDANKQWASDAGCVAAMKATAKLVAPYNTADVSKKDFGCFFYHLTVAATDAATAATHCRHINPATPSPDAKCTM